LAIALIAYLKTGTFSDESALSNAAEGTAPPPAVEVAEPIVQRESVYQPMSRRRVIVAIVLMAAFTIFALIPVKRFGKDVKVATTRQKATEVSAAFLRGRNVDVDSYRKAAWLTQNVDGSAFKYLNEHLAPEQVDQVYREATRLVLWDVRFFKPL